MSEDKPKPQKKPEKPKVVRGSGVLVKPGIDDDAEASKQYQIEITARLQRKLLERFERLLDQDLITPPEMATLTKLLASNGWTLDPAMLPKGLRSKITDLVDPAEFLDDDPDLPKVN